MDTQLAGLEERIRRVVALCQNLRRENIALRQDLAASQQKLKQLDAKLEATKIRLSSLINHLPEDA
jgi:cell division protein ZapB